MFPRNRRLYVKLFRYSCLLISIVFLLNYFGIFLHLFETNFEHFKYPFDGDAPALCYQLRKGQKPDVEPINNHTYSYRHNNENKCKDELQNSLMPHLLIVVKSKNTNFERRNAIRNSWGFEKRFSDILIRRVFSLGIDKATHDGKPSGIQKLIDLEAEKYQDIIQVSNTYAKYYKISLLYSNISVLV